MRAICCIFCSCQWKIRKTLESARFARSRVHFTRYQKSGPLECNIVWQKGPASIWRWLAQFWESYCAEKSRPITFWHLQRPIWSISKIWPIRARFSTSWDSVRIFVPLCLILRKLLSSETLRASCGPWFLTVSQIMCIKVLFQSLSHISQILVAIAIILKMPIFSEIRFPFERVPKTIGNSHTGVPFPGIFPDRDQTWFIW